VWIIHKFAIEEGRGECPNKNAHFLNCPSLVEIMPCRQQWAEGISIDSYIKLK
jgi:hypothetical protein